MTTNKRLNKCKRFIIILAIVISLSILTGGFYSSYQDDIAYARALHKFNKGDEDRAGEIFQKLGEFEDSKSYLLKIDYNKACTLMDSKEYDGAASIFISLKGYADSAEKLDTLYSLIADDYFLNYDFENALEYYEKSNNIDGLTKTQIAYGDYLYNENDFEGAIERWSQYAEKKEIDEKIKTAEYELIILAASQDENYEQVIKANQLAYDERACKAVSDMLSMPAGQTKTLDASETHIIYLSSDGNVYADGSNSHGQCNVEDWSGVISLCASELNSYALLYDRTVVAAGSNVFGQCEVSDWENIVSICANDGAVFGLNDKGRVIYSGGAQDCYKEVSKWKNITRICAGKEHVVALDKFGNVFAAGRNDYGQCDVDEFKNISDIACGPMHTILIKNDGKVAICGVSAAFEEEIADWDDVQCASSSWSHIVLQDSQGNLFAAGANERNQCDVTKWEDIVTYTARANFTIGVKRDGSVLTTVKGHELDWNVMVWKDTYTQ